ncbi:DUF559 domain-containing protein [Microbacterium sp. ARD32]|uniref:DUF559 domain-containing protein n=1 Tax=Microbacterium sp. ARD32 TaxID=2962577 RepID=UPI002881BEAC|nr:DUF559 domain-containing protein [Microbacterium sp. ARD32]MDT0156510.1 DUF559 domain-containing protein [Microbacterium sp. ARD32]
MENEPLPSELGRAFAVRTARAHGVGRGRLRSADLRAPFHGVRVQGEAAGIDESLDPYERQRRARVARARDYAPRLHGGHFFSHQTAASIWGAPLPLEIDDFGRPAALEDLELHVCARGALPLPRASGVTGHRTLDSLTSVRMHDDLRVSSPAATWVSLGTLSVVQLVALGDYFCRQWRQGVGRLDAGRPPLTTTGELRNAINAGRRRGAARLRTAVELIREDSWSPRESQVRCLLVQAGLPEPDLNVDVFDEAGRFIGCVDMAYPEQRVIVEYHGVQHGQQWARDVERAAALRAAGWTIIEVTYPLLDDPRRLIRRVAAALRR